ncbi:MAG: hypothetical protein HS132_07645 [Planctomycetia bacterium]|nr:hypothetical protein [Planctomycetia bacterium]
MAKKVNKKKIVSICPVGIIKTRCPSIRRTRQIRVKLLTLQRESNIDGEQITQLRSALKAKKKRGIALDCETCTFNTAERASAGVS